MSIILTSYFIIVSSLYIGFTQIDPNRQLYRKIMGAFWCSSYAITTLLLLNYSEFKICFSLIITAWNLTWEYLESYPRMFKEFGRFEDISKLWFYFDIPIFFTMLKLYFDNYFETILFIIIYFYIHIRLSDENLRYLSWIQYNFHEWYPLVNLQNFGNIDHLINLFEISDYESLNLYLTALILRSVGTVILFVGGFKTKRNSLILIILGILSFIPPIIQIYLINNEFESKNSLINLIKEINIFN